MPHTAASLWQGETIPYAQCMEYVLTCPNIYLKNKVHHGSMDQLRHPHEHRDSRLKPWGVSAGVLSWFSQHAQTDPDQRLGSYLYQKLS